MSAPSIIYTITDEAPRLATASLLPIIRSFCAAAGLSVETRDISLAGRILAAFPECLRPEQRQGDDLAELGALATTPAARIIKLPNISASIPQLCAAITELQGQGYAVPDFPQDPADDAQRAIRQRYRAVLGSAVNPVLREGNSDRRVAQAVKDHARRHPPRMAPWRADSPAHVAHMDEGDFYANEQSQTLEAATSARIELVGSDGSVTVLVPALALAAGDVVDATVMRVAALRRFLAREIDDAKARGLLFSIHLKATMMKVSDPIIFGQALEVFLTPVFARHGERLAALGVRPDNGLGALLSALETLPEDERQAIVTDIDACLAERPPLAMVDSDRGITNLHVPSDIIIDASMPPAIRDGGRMWGPDGALHDAKMVIPDRCYAGVYQAVIDDCKQHGAFDPRTMGSVANVGLMAQKAEEYGSHPTTFRVPAAGHMRVVSTTGATLFEHQVEAGDIWRLGRTTAAAIDDWIRLAVRRARTSGSPAIFWLDAQRAHDAQLIAAVQALLPQLDCAGLELSILAPAAACTATLARVRAGQDCIAVTGNVLRDYLTDLFPILELGTSAKMLSIVPLLAGGGLYETGAGGSAPKHVQQFVAENHLRWDSLGEFLALAACLEELAAATGDQRLTVLAQALHAANSTMLEHDRSPSRRCGELDNRGSHVYLTLYWAQALASQDRDPALAARFTPLAQALAEHIDDIIAELEHLQGQTIDLGGYYHPDPARLDAAMRPSTRFNDLLSNMEA